jgi:hypothetical protein
MMMLVPTPKSCSRRWQFQSDATWQILESGEAFTGAPIRRHDSTTERIAATFGPAFTLPT